MLQCSAFSLNLFINKNDATGNHIPPLFSPKKYHPSCRDEYIDGEQGHNSMRHTVLAND
jgi:hypothetical protein